MNNYSSYTITFTNSVGTRVELPKITSYLEYKPQLAETETHYVVRVVDLNSLYQGGWSDYTSCYITPGAHIALKDRRASVPDIRVSSECYLNKPEDASAFYYGGNLRPTYELKDLKLEVNMFQVEDAFNWEYGFDDAYVTVYNTEVDAATFMETCDWEHTHWSPDCIRALFCVIHEAEFADFIELREFVDKATKWSEKGDLVIDFSDGDEHHIDGIVANLNSYCITIPEWAYYLIDKYEHSGITYSISGTGYECRWDTSHGVGIWFLQDEEIKNLQEYIKNHPDEDPMDITAKWCKHDLKLISDCEPMYSVYDYYFSKKDLNQEDVEEIDSHFYDDIKELEKSLTPGTLGTLRNLVKQYNEPDFTIKDEQPANEWRV